ncbi:hypothetical protein OROHE_026022 [Orobanche hederae]
MGVETRTQEGETKTQEVERLNREEWVREADRSIKVRRENFQKKWAKLTENQRMRILKRMSDKSRKFHESMVGYSAQYEKDNPGRGGFLFGAPKASLEETYPYSQVCYMEYAKLAIEDYNTKHHSEFEAVTVERMDVTGGTIWHHNITFTAKDAKDPNAACLTFQADVTFNNAGKKEVVFCKRE